MNPNEWESLGGFVSYMTTRTRRPQVNAVCPVCRRAFRGEDRVYDLTGPRGFRALCHERCVTVRKERGQLLMAPKPPSQAASAPSWDRFVFWTILAGLALLLLFAVLR